jgi:hypothetical protein
MKITKEQFQSLNQLDRIEYTSIINSYMLLDMKYLIAFSLAIICSLLINGLFFKFCLLIIAFYSIIKPNNLVNNGIENLNKRFFEIKPRGKK